MKCAHVAAVIGLMAALAVGSTRTLQACQCGLRADARTSAARSTYVVQARVTNVRKRKVLVTLTGAGAGSWKEELQEVQLAVMRYWGACPPQDLRLLLGVTNCDYPWFRPDGSFLVFIEPADGVAGAFTASKCSATCPLRSAESTLRELGPGVAVRAAVSE